MEGLVEIASSSRWRWATQRHAERTHRAVNTTLSTDGAKIRHERRTGALEAHANEPISRTAAVAAAASVKGRGPRKLPR